MIELLNFILKLFEQYFPGLLNVKQKKTVDIDEFTKIKAHYNSDNKKKYIKNSIY